MKWGWVVMVGKSAGPLNLQVVTQGGAGCLAYTTTKDARTMLPASLFATCVIRSNYLSEHRSPKVNGQGTSAHLGSHKLFCKLLLTCDWGGGWVAATVLRVKIDQN